MTSYLESVSSVVPNIAPYVPFLRTGMERWEINTPLRAAHFLAQIAVESGAFSHVAESLDYRYDKLQPLFGSHRISAADAKKFGRSVDGRTPANQNALANILYGGEWGLEHLGNTTPGDGWKFRGGGLTQTTGRANYQQMSHVIYGDNRLLDNPDLIHAPEAAALSACAFWHIKGCNAPADRDDIEAVTHAINGGQNGLDGTGGRRWWLARFRNLLHC